MGGHPIAVDGLPHQGNSYNVRQRFTQGDILVTSAPFKYPKEGWQVLHFALPFAAPGISLADDWRTLGMYSTGSQTIILDKIFVPDDAIALRRPRGGFIPHRTRS
ncbi:MAG TPA: hypothetical protein VHV26_14875 [Rhizomicrobium sp.]|jgi:hypothetical protein|nr:hypothetical protein [Rhizomicrobium sp.]